MTDLVRKRFSVGIVSEAAPASAVTEVAAELFPSIALRLPNIVCPLPAHVNVKECNFVFWCEFKSWKFEKTCVIVCPSFSGKVLC